MSDLEFEKSTYRCIELFSLLQKVTEAGKRLSNLLTE